MPEISTPDPWITPELGLTIDDGPTFAGGYDVNTFTLSDLGGFGSSMPKNVGYWRISENFCVYVAKRPNRLNRAATRFLLGWEWTDA